MKEVLVKVEERWWWWRWWGRFTKCISWQGVYVKTS